MACQYFGIMSRGYTLIRVVSVRNSCQPQSLACLLYLHVGLQPQVCQLLKRTDTLWLVRMLCSWFRVEDTP